MGGLLLGLSMARAGAGTLGCPAAREGHRGHGTSAGAQRWHRWHWHLGAQAPVLSSGIGSIGISGHGRWCSVMVSVALASQQLCGCPGLWQCPLGWRGRHVAGGAWGGSAWGRQPPTSMPLQGERELPALCLRSACPCVAGAASRCRGALSMPAGGPALGTGNLSPSLSWGFSRGSVGETPQPTRPHSWSSGVAGATSAGAPGLSPPCHKQPR